MSSGGSKFDNHILNDSAMSKRTLSIVLVLLAIISIAYAIYKGTAPTITTIETGRTVVYGQPQHGLTLGLGVFAGMCVLGASLLLMDERRRIVDEVQTPTTTTTASGSRVATNYPR
jgi:hypothetical protein